ncbi:Ankyrin repeat protein [Giardia duodenalis]|uniref:Protein 21.1 n=2 Tax=Giardia intestinalis TaxID=5741 RepID=C6LNT5_GIAIB|nr:Protein 21.1 [Giardia intestinalis ATCC 50581]ESU45395.1 Ankyrin repeat protein [Giardia intestinalis]
MLTSVHDWFNGICSRKYAQVKASIEIFGGRKDEDGMTGLMRAAIIGDAEMCQILAISESCAVTRTGFTALMYACQSNNVACCKVLAPLERLVILSDCKTALMIAAEVGSFECCKELLKYLGPERDSNGMGALEYAIMGNYFDIVKLLVEHGNLGKCDLIECARMAAREGYMQIASWLDDWLLTNKRIGNASSLVMSHYRTASPSPQFRGVSPRSILRQTLSPPEHPNSYQVELVEPMDLQVQDKIQDKQVDMPEERILTEDLICSDGQPDGQVGNKDECECSELNAARKIDNRKGDNHKVDVAHYSASRDEDPAKSATRGSGNEVLFHNLTPTLKSQSSSLGNSSRTSQTASPVNAIQKLGEFVPQYSDSRPNPVTQKTGNIITQVEEKLSQSDLDTVKHISNAVTGFAATHDTLEQLQQSLQSSAAEAEASSLPQRREVHLDFDATPLMHAAVSDDLYQAQINMKYARTVTSNNQTSLMLAIQSGSLRVAKELVIIEGGFQDLDGRTALMYAVQLGSLDLVEMLAAVESGLVDSHGCTALMYAVRDNKEALASVLVRTEGCIRNNYGDTALHIAIASKSFACIPCLAAVEARIRDSHNRTALMNACALSLLQACQILVQYEAGQVDDNGNTCLHMAVLSKNVPLVSILAPKEAHIRNGAGKTALMLAIDNGNREIIDILSHFEASVADHNNITPLMLVSETGMIESLPTLALHSRNIDQCNIYGQSALVLALSSQQYEVAAELSQADGQAIAARAQYNPRDIDKQVRSGHVAVDDDDIVTIWELIRRLDPERTDIRYDLLDHALRANKLSIATLIADSIWQKNSLKKYGAELHLGLIDQHNLVKGAELFVQRNLQTLVRNASLRKKLEKTPIESREIKRDINGYTPLHLAVMDNNLIDVWQTQDTYATAVDADGNTALMLAAIYGYRECAQILMSKEAGLTRSFDGVTAMHLALLHRHMDVAEVLAPVEAPDVSACRRTNNRQTELMMAAMANDLSRCYCLRGLQQGLIDQEKNTALIFAAKGGHDAAVALLVEHEHSRQDIKSWSANMHAAFKGHTECVRILSNYEAGMSDVSGVTALMLAAFEGHLDVVELLISAEAGIQTQTGFTALMSAARRGHEQVVESLIEYEAGMTTDQGVTALMEAAAMGYTEIVKLLVTSESGFRTNASHPNGAGFTALMAAAQGDHPDCYEALYEYEKDVVQPNGATADLYATGPRMRKYLS